jgi:hypothetical protein
VEPAGEILPLETSHRELHDLATDVKPQSAAMADLASADVLRVQQGLAHVLFQLRFHRCTYTGKRKLTVLGACSACLVEQSVLHGLLLHAG